MRHIVNEDGFTLVELLVGIILLALIFGTTSSIVGNMLHMGQETELDAGLQQEGKWALDLMTRELRYGMITNPNMTTTTLPYDGSTITFQKAKSDGMFETITYGVGSDSGLTLQKVLGRYVAGGILAPITNQQVAVIENEADLNFHIIASGNDSHSAEIKITLKLTGTTKKSSNSAYPTATFETTVYTLNRF